MKLGRSAVDRAPPAPRTGRWACGPRLTSWTGHVSLRPGGASPFLRLPLAELRNQIVSLDAIRGRARAALLLERGSCEVQEHRIRMAELERNGRTSHMDPHSSGR